MWHLSLSGLWEVMKRIYLDFVVSTQTFAIASYDLSAHKLTCCVLVKICIYHGLVMKEGCDVQVALNSSVLEKVIRAIEQATYIGDRRVALETRLTCDLALGGFGRLKLALYVEEIFDIELSDDVVERFVTVADIVRYVGGHYFQDAEPLRLAEAV